MTLKKLIFIFFIVIIANLLSSEKQIIDNFDSINGWKLFSQGLGYYNLDDESRKCMVLDYDLNGRDYVVIINEKKIKFPRNFKLEFYLKTTGPKNNIEIKFASPNGNMYWYKKENYSTNDDWKKILVSDRDVEYAWGPHKGKPLSVVNKIEIAVSKGEGGKGKIYIDDMSIIESAGAVKIYGSDGKGEYNAESAYDDDFSTRWSTSFSDPQWLKLRFSQPKKIIGLRIYWEKAYARGYNIKVSKDAVHWKEVYKTDSGNGGIDDITFSKPEEVKVIKFIGTQRGTYWGYSLYEIELKTTDVPWGEYQTPDVLYSTEWNFQTGNNKKINSINLGRSWQRQGYQDYKGQVIYSNNFFIPDSWRGNEPKLHITDVFGEKAVLFINRKRIEKNILGNKTSILDIGRYVKYNKFNFFKIIVEGNDNRNGVIGNVLIIKDEKSLENKLYELRKKSHKDYYSFLADIKPDGSFPFWLKGEQGYWTVTGINPGYRESLVCEDGSIEPFKSFIISPFIFYDNKLFKRTNVELNQRLAGEHYPIPTIEWKTNKCVFTTEAFSSGQPKKERTYIKYSLKNVSKTDIEIKLYLTVRPFEINPPWQWGGYHNITNIEITDKWIQADQFRIHLSEKPSDAGCLSYFDKETIEYISESKMPAHRKIHDKNGFASGIVEYKVILKPNETKNYYMLVPLYEESSNQISAKEYNIQYKTVAAYWDKIISRIPFTISDKDIMNTIKANLSYIFINKDGPALQPGSRAYDAAWMRDGALSSVAFLRYGFNREVKEFIEWYEKYIYEDGRVPAIVIINRDETNPVKEYDSQGEYIHTIYEYYLFNKEKTFLQKRYSSIKKVLDYLKELRSQRLTSKYRYGPFYGILPNCVSHEGYYPEPGNHSYWDDFWGIRGWKDAQAIAEILNKPELKKLANTEEKELRKSLLRSIDYITKEKNLDYIPGCAELGDFDPTSTAIALNISGEIEYLSERLVHRTFSKYLEEVEKRKKKNWTGSFSPYEIRNVQVLLLLDKRDEAIELFDFLLKFRYPEKWYQWSEAIYRPIRTNGYIGDMPHTWISSGFLNTVRMMLLYEDETKGDLILCKGIHPDWLKSGGNITVKDAPTYWGKISYTLKKHDDKHFEINVSGDVKQPGRIIVHSPPGKKIKNIDSDKYVKLRNNKMYLKEIPCSININY